ncbi:LacI family DNA-binding transcriptional regulator [Pelagicoccus enzymogenes]|uniref:LacI family DNA-binding transcriptional regulator n=1 Tax=Pelagicoccus enzymogenes TaxID=2773457 RepID=UPI00280D884D|nr:LacI family DNA-binding transcriptional regulator [Pelagicoccus enzymogenes]MDQ8199439.1 LacI family DNA-binding transcriptional regulator [Pelagicoccus enzymogenes]
MDRKNPTMEMIAAAAGVSKMSVSRCLRGHPSNSKETQDRIRKIAEEMGYVPNPMVSSLMAGIRSRKKGDCSTVIAVLDDFEGKRPPLYQRSWSEHIDGLRSRADQLGYKLDVFRYREQRLNDRSLSRVLRARNIRGLVIPYQVRIIDLRGVDLSSFACVALGYTVKEPDFHRVCPHYYDGMKIALRKVEAFGYRRPGFVTNANNLVRTKRYYLASYLAEMYSLGRPPRVLCLDDSMGDVKGEIVEWVEREKVDCLVSSFHEAVTVLKDTGWSIPRDIGYVQLNWTPSFAGLAGVKNRNRLQGIQAVNLVNAAILSNDYGIPKEPFVHIVRNEWVEGGSLIPR